MKVFAHGSNVNFQTSTREMFFTDLEALIQHQKDKSDQFIMGHLKHAKEQLAVYGLLLKSSLNDSIHIFETEEETIEWKQEQFYISQEAVFTIEDEREGKKDFTVIYLTYEDDEGESVLFFMDETAVTHPLACVVQFYEQVKEIGRDVDFSLIGCTANEWKPSKK
ncbi:hypothetical protein [Shimazuella kribbensis]|uniref:hypothetical protein n=1 Tax=Shimazuella kribbensis TaxID=139808 RepID=UPI000400B828|nr:hypothetical protein [Shimazuella kribbensis]